MALEIATTRQGFVKVKLIFTTMTPRHLRSQTLQLSGVPGPYYEDMCILYPQKHAYPITEIYLPALNTLRTERKVPQDANLVKIQLLPEDVYTQAYLVE
jgi:hypothetical protein